VAEVSRGLSDASPDVSGTAALALAVRGSEASISSLASSAFDPDPQVRRSVARVLPEAVASQVLPVEQAFALAERLAGDTAPATRRLAAGALRLFDGRAAHRLAGRLARDPDPGVRAAAAAVLKQM
jgi:HEAT repeat protein